MRNFALLILLLTIYSCKSQTNKDSVFVINYTIDSIFEGNRGKTFCNKFASYEYEANLKNTLNEFADSLFICKTDVESYIKNFRLGLRDSLSFYVRNSNISFIPNINYADTTKYFTHDVFSPPLFNASNNTCILIDFGFYYGVPMIESFFIFKRDINLKWTYKYHIDKEFKSKKFVHIHSNSFTVFPAKRRL